MYKMDYVLDRNEALKALTQGKIVTHLMFADTNKYMRCAKNGRFFSSNGSSFKNLDFHDMLKYHGFKTGWAVFECPAGGIEPLFNVQPPKHHSILR